MLDCVGAEIGSARTLLQRAEGMMGNDCEHHRNLSLEHGSHQMRRSRCEELGSAETTRAAVQKAAANFEKFEVQFFLLRN